MAGELNVAVTGLGYFSQFHLDAWAGLNSIESIAVTDPVAARVKWAEDTYPATGYLNVTALLANTAPDIVDIIAPPPAHADLIRSFAARGRILICQKPFCTSLKEAEEITAFAEAAGATLVIHENFRFQPWYRTIKQFLDAGHLGAVYQCRFFLRPGDGRGPDAYLERQPAFQTMPRLLIHETALHFIDLFRWLFGDVTDVYADIRRLNPVLAGEDAAVLILNHASGVQSTFDGNRLADHVADNPRKTMGEMVVEGEKGVIRLTGQGRLFFRPFGETREQSVALIATVDDTSFGGGCAAALIQHVVSFTQGSGVLENTAKNYLPVIRVTEAAYVSAAEKRRILVNS